MFDFDYISLQFLFVSEPKFFTRSIHFGYSNLRALTILPVILSYEPNNVTIKVLDIIFEYFARDTLLLGIRFHYIIQVIQYLIP